MTHIRKILGLLAVTVALISPLSGFAADRIVAVVNDQVITQNQLDARTTLNMRTLGLVSPKDAQRAAVQRRALSTLIDEELQRQYAATAKLKVTDKDIAAAREEAIKAVGGEANFTSLTKGLEGATKEKLAAETLWKRIIARDIQPRVQVSTAEADRLISELAKSRHVLDREISIIQLNVEDESGSEKVQLDKITELKKKITDGETFADIARANSDDKSAAKGGNLGWFSSGELNPQLEGALDKMQPGQVSDPIRTPLGWYLVKLENVRTTKPVETGPVTQVDIFLLASQTPEDAAAAKDMGQKIDEQADELKDTAAVRNYFSGGGYTSSFPSSTALGWIAESDLDPTLLEVVKKTENGKWSKLTTIKDTTMRVFVADRRQAMPAQLQAYRERVLNNMYGSRIELESRRFMQNLRQRAFLDVRG